MLLILLALRHWPDFVAAIIDPAALYYFAGRRNVFPLVLRIHEQIGVARKCDLHHAPAELRHDRDPHPRIAQLFRAPAANLLGFNAPSGRILGSGPLLRW